MESKMYLVMGWMHTDLEALNPLRGPLHDRPLRIQADSEQAAKAEYARRTALRPWVWDDDDRTFATAMQRPRVVIRAVQQGKGDPR